jgi:CHAT domain-containing protein
MAAEDDLCILPLQALPGRARSFVAEEQQIRYVTTGRDLVREHPGSDPDSASSVVVADPDYDHGVNREDQGGAASGYRRFGRIPGARKEGEHVAGLLKVKPWVGAEATKERVIAVKSPPVLHFATHGFFMPAEDKEDSSSTESMRRSGLALAGANIHMEEGVLTAEDATRLQLANTELVVLSACETGIGDTRIGEGVFGLRRAFLIAGTRSLVVSLWRVPDKETSELMSELYQQLLVGTGLVEALEAAQGRIRQKQSHPYFWGSFICVGDGSALTLCKAKNRTARH